MKSNTRSDSLHRQLLVHCTVTNANGQSSERFIEHREFPLWQYLVEKRHGLIVSHCIPCVWVPAAEGRRHDRLFSHANFNAPVLRVTFENFDADTGVTETHTRWLATQAREQILPLLERHLTAGAAASVVGEEAGEAISTSPASRRSTWRSAGAYCAA